VGAKESADGRKVLFRPHKTRPHATFFFVAFAGNPEPRGRSRGKGESLLHNFIGVPCEKNTNSICCSYPHAALFHWAYACRAEF